MEETINFFSTIYELDFQRRMLYDAEYYVFLLQMEIRFSSHRTENGWKTLYLNDLPCVNTTKLKNTYSIFTLTPTSVTHVVVADNHSYGEPEIGYNYVTCYCLMINKLGRTIFVFLLQTVMYFHCFKGTFSPRIRVRLRDVASRGGAGLRRALLLFVALYAL